MRSLVVGADPSAAPQGEREAEIAHMLLVGRSREVHAKASRLGLRLSALIATSKLPTTDTTLYGRLTGLPGDAEVDEWVDAALAIDRHDPITAIGGFNEEFQPHAAAIAQRLGLPFHEPQTIRATREKVEMRRVLRECGLDDTHAEVVGNAGDIEAFAAAHGYPVVVKPLDARGSLGVSIVGSRGEVAQALTWYCAHSSAHRMMVEQFLEGEELSVEAFSEEGLHRVICVTRKYKHPRTNVETGHCLPAPLDAGARDAIEAYVEAVLTALGIRSGPSHTEVIMTARGPRLVETHPRIGGDGIVDLIRLTSSVDLDELWIRQSAGARVRSQLPRALEGFAAVMFATPRARGTLERVDGLDEAEAMAGVHKVEVLRSPGSEIGEVYHSDSRGACAIAVADTADEAASRARLAVSNLRFVVSCAG